MKVNLYWIVECLFLPRYSHMYIDKKTLEFVSEYEYEKIIDNQEDCIPIYTIEDEKYIALMKKFCNIINDKNYPLTMEESLKEHKEYINKSKTAHDRYNDLEDSFREDSEYIGGFYHFVGYNDLEDEWLEFRNKETLKDAKEFCERNHLDYYIDKNIIGTLRLKKINVPIDKKDEGEFYSKKQELYTLSKMKEKD